MGRRFTVTRTSEGKKCCRCRRLLSRDSFYRSANTVDGLAYQCKECQKEYTKQKTDKEDRKELKRQYVEKCGGQCIRCGYKEFISALDFHHTEDKQFPVATLFTNARKGNVRHLLTLERELSKCVILCRNCHSALHAGEWEAGDLEYSRRQVIQVSLVDYEIQSLPLFESFDR